jgi:hypothetical protein
MRTHGPGALGHHTPATQEHYHLIYHVPTENLSIPYFKDVYPTAREAYLRVAELGRQAEPRTEWFDDGEVGFETKLPGRMGLYWVVVEVTGCIRGACRQFMTREMLKRTLVIVPEDGETVPLEQKP